MKFILKKIIPSIFRGIVKSVPFGNELLPEKEKEKTEQVVELIVKLICVGAIIYAYFQKEITIFDFIKLIDGSGTNANN